MMLCDKCKTPMEKAGSLLTRNQEYIVTCFMCPRCFSRKVETTPNPRYQMMVGQREQEEDRARRTRIPPTTSG